MMANLPHLTAQALIMAGKVFSGDRAVAKSGDLLPENVELAVRGQDHPWVSRGGLKLDHALRHFELSPSGLVCLDVGASTGGFSDVLLARGAAKIHAVDVGHGQLAWKLRNDPRILVHEKTNARYLTAAMVPDPIEALVCDASFIGLSVVLPACLALCTPGAWAVALIKPQFEAGRNAVGKGGVVKSAETHIQVLSYVNDFAASIDLHAVDFTYSPVKGPAGNIEFLAHLRRGSARVDFDFAALVAAANQNL